MNPVLLKPGSDRRSHVVVMGQPAGEIASAEFIGGRTHLAEAAFAAYDDLASRFDLVVCEGAGSPAEINLRAGDFVNMGLARHAGMPVVVVGDIDRGGVFAAMYGTRRPARRRRPAADGRLRRQQVPRRRVAAASRGSTELERRTGRRVLGVLPWSPDLWLDSEDALELGGRRSTSTSGALRVAVVRLPRISNFTDVDALGIEPGVDVQFVSRPAVDGRRRPRRAARHAGDAGRPRLAAVARARPGDPRRTSTQGRPVLGICGGFQMLGRTIRDPEGVEGVPGAEAAGPGSAGGRHDLRAGEGAAAARGQRRVRDPPRPGRARRTTSSRTAG